MEVQALDREQPAIADQADSAKRRQIMDGARKVFLTQGFDGASMGEIARAAGVSKGTLYVYFDSKEKLFQAITHEACSLQAEGIFSFDHADHDVAAVLARTGSSPRGLGSRSRPAARDISTTAVGGRALSDCSSMRHSASTGFPRGPATVVWCLVPPRASSRPSPPSDIGTSSAVHPAPRAAAAMVAATSVPLAVPRNLSGAATGWGTGGTLPNGPRARDPLA